MSRRVILFKKKGAVSKVTLTGFTDDPARDLAYYDRKELERLLGADRKSPIMIVVK